ncbi:MAG: DUF1570 domain-containing protein [Pirellulaceae bacterium]
MSPLPNRLGFSLASLALDCLFLLALITPRLSADVVLYRLPTKTGSLVVPLEGKATVNPGATVTFRHSSLGNLYMDAKNVSIHKLPHSREVAQKKIAAAEAAEDIDACFAAAKFCLRVGQLDHFYKAAASAWRIDPDHPMVKRLVAMKAKVDRPAPIDAAQETYLRNFVNNRADMRVMRSKHYIMLHDTDATPHPRTKRTRAEERLRLLEIVYESFMMKFCINGVDLEVPEQPLMVVLFGDHQNYLRFVTLLSPELSSTAGFYLLKEKIVFFFDQGTTDDFKELAQISQILKRNRDEAIRTRRPGAKDVIRLSNTVELLVELERTNEDVSTVSHEASHQLANTTGLFTFGKYTPLWAAEGIGTYFETPKSAAWGGIGAVNEQRLDWYRVLGRFPAISNIPVIVSDRVFSRAEDGFDQMHAYAQAWALTHFLMEHHFEELMAYYQEVQLLDVKSGNVTEQDLVNVFYKCFAGDPDNLERRWKQYMQTLRTDIEQAILGF